QQDRDPREFQSRDCPLPEAIFLVERRISLSWTMHGQTRMPMSLPSLPGPGSGSPRWSIIGTAGWLRTVIVLQSLFLVGHSTDRAAGDTLRPRTNFLMLLLPGLEIQIHGSEQPGRRAKDSRSSSRIIGPCWFWMAWSRSKIRQVHKK